MPDSHRIIAPLVLLTALVATPLPLHAWNFEGHRTINELALAGLPADFPAFVHEKDAAGRIGYLAGEPDRWRNVPDLSLRQVNDPNHYLDYEQLPMAGLDLRTCSPQRYVFAVAFADARRAHIDQFPEIDPTKNADHTREWAGFAPWEIAEDYAKLKSAFSCLRAYEEAGGTPEEIANAKANAVYIMGVMGHYVGDCCQPLHTTDQFNGWVGPNPKGYTTWKGFHSWIDGGYMATIKYDYESLIPRARPAVVLPAPVAGEPETPAEPAPTPPGTATDPIFSSIAEYFLTQHAQVEPLYEEEKEGHLQADGSPGSTDGTAFLEEQMLRGGQMLASLWYTAWRTAPVDVYQKSQLALRNAGQPAKYALPPPHHPAGTTAPATP